MIYANHILPAAATLDAINKGILRSILDCERWGLVWPSDRGCENLLQVRCAEEIARLKNRHDNNDEATCSRGWITLEENYSSIKDHGSSKRGRPFNSITGQQRADIALWKDEVIYCVVEIKRHQDPVGWAVDIEKISQNLNMYSQYRNNYLKYVAFGAYLYSNSEDGLKEKIRKVKSIAAKVAMRRRQRLRFAPANSVVYWNNDIESGHYSTSIALSLSQLDTVQP